MKTILTLFFALLSAAAFAQTDVCATPAQVAPQIAYSNPDPLNGEYCVTEYVEVNYDIIQAFGSQGARDYMEGSLNAKSMAFAKHDINLSFIVKYWDTPSPYTATTTGGLLDQFRTHVTNNGGHDGDMGHLVTFLSSGGLAYVDVLCRQNFGFAVSSINDTYAPYPEPSWTSTVQIHESGHMLGCSHSHACIYTIDGVPNQAIDGCSPFGTEGGCESPGYPISGSFMSYCHLVQSVGIDYDFGFHPIHVATMKNRIANAACTECEDDGPDNPEPPACLDNLVIVEVQLDNYPTETSWALLTSDSVPVALSPSWPKNQMNTYHADSICVPDGCYLFVAEDVDGLAGYGCGEGMYIVSTDEGEVASGQTWAGVQTTQICLGVDPPSGECLPAGPYPDHLESYVNQDRQGGVSVSGENFVKIKGNSWKHYPMNYSLTTNTVLEGQVFYNGEGEIHGIAFVDQTGALAPAKTIQFGGSQGWGIAYEGVTAGSWQNISIPVGAWVGEGDYTNVVLINDQDVPFATAETGWRLLEFCESGTSDMKRARPQVRGKVEDEAVAVFNSPLGSDRVFELSCMVHHLDSNGNTIPCPDKYSGFDQQKGPVVEDVILIRPYPNPVTDTLHLPTCDKWTMYSMTGEMVASTQSGSIDMSAHPSGLYLVMCGEEAHLIVKS